MVKKLKYFSMLLILLVCAALIYKEQFILAGGLVALYMGLVFGMDKIKISKTGIEVEDKK